MPAKGSGKRSPTKSSTAEKAPAGIPARLWAAFQKQHASHDEELNAALSSLLGRPLPADLRAYGGADSPEGSVFIPSVKELVRPGVSSFERIVETCDTRGEALRQIFTGCFYLTEIEGDGDCIFAYVSPGLEEETCLVTVWSHEEATFGDPIAEDIASFEAAWAISNEEGLTPEAAKPRLSPLKKRIYFRWPFNSESFPGNELLSGCFAKEPRKNSIQFLQARAEWIITLLTGEKLAPHLWPTDQLGADLTKVIGHVDFARRPASALYCLWRSFLLGEEEQLGAILAKLEGTPSRLLEDAARTVRELRSGRKELGLLKDLHAIRAWLSETVKDPEKAQAAIKAVEREKRQRAFADGIAEAGLRVEAVDDQPRAVGMNGYDGWWPLPGGGEVVLSYHGLFVKERAGAEAVRLDVHANGDISGVSPGADGSHLLVSWLSALAAVPLPSGPMQIRWSAGVGDVSYVAGGRVAALGRYGTLLLLEPRGTQLVPTTTHAVLGEQLQAVLGGRVVLTFSGAGFTALGIYDGGAVELARAPAHVLGIAEADGRVLLSLEQNEWLELVGLEERWDAQRAAAPDGRLPEHEIYEKLGADPRPTTALAGEDRARVPGAIHRLRRDGLVFAVLPEGEGFALAWEHDGAIRKTELFPLGGGYEWSDGQLEVVVSPRRDHALFFRRDLSTIYEVDLATAKQDLERSDDPRSGTVLGAGYISDAVFCWAHWQCHVHRRGEEEQVVYMEPRYSSVAGAAVPGTGNHFFAGVSSASADGSQHLEVLEIAGLDGPERSWKWHPIYPLGSRLATVTRQGDDLLLIVAGEAYRLKLPALL